MTALRDDFWEEEWRFRHPGLRCFLGHHAPLIESRWTINRHRGQLWEMWTVERCDRCGRILRGRDTGKRWVGPS